MWPTAWARSGVPVPARRDFDGVERDWIAAYPLNERAPVCRLPLDHVALRGQDRLAVLGHPRLTEDEHLAGGLEGGQPLDLALTGLPGECAADDGGGPATAWALFDRLKRVDWCL